MELWDVYDKNRNKKNRIHERGVPLAEGDFHIVVHVWIMNRKGEILLTKRHHDKKFHPNLWECSAGSILVGENSLDGAVREVNEEIGIKLSRSNGKMIKSERCDVNNDIYDIWLFKQSFDITETVLQESEVSDIKWVTRHELEEIYSSNSLVPTLSYYKKIFQ
ncbi:NUDIX hydrolase [Cytobacillus sp. Hm23]